MTAGVMRVNASRRREDARVLTHEFDGPLDAGELAPRDHHLTDAGRARPLEDRGAIRVVARVHKIDADIDELHMGPAWMRVRNGAVLSFRALTFRPHHASRRRRTQQPAHRALV